MTLTFLHWGIAAAGLAAASVPILVHLLLKQKPKPLKFPALRLIRLRHVQAQRRLRLQHILLMLLRMALLLLLGLALSRPTLKSDLLAIDQEAPIAAAMVFDTSASMGYRREGKTRLEVAREMAQTLIEQLPDGSEIYLIESSNPVGGLPSDLPGAMKRLQLMEPQMASQPVDAALAAAYQTLSKSQLERQELYVFSDLAASGWQRDDGGRLERLRGLAQTEPKLYVLDVGVEEPENVLVVPPRIDEGALATGELSLDITIRNGGGQRDATLELWLDDEARARKEIRLPEGQAIELDLQVPGLAEGWHLGRVALETDDPLGFDDTRYLAVEVRPPLRVLLVSDEPGDALFWRTALVPDDSPARDRSPYQVQSIRTGQLGETDLEPFDVVALLNAGGPTNEQWASLGQFVRNGGGAFIAAADRIDPASYGTEAAQAVLPGVPQEQVASEEGTYVRPENFLHPVLGPFRTTEQSDLPLLAVFRYWRVEPVEGASTPVDYADGAPALLERTFGQGERGRVLLLTTAAHYDPEGDIWTELPLGWSFLVLTRTITDYLGGLDRGMRDFPPGGLATVELDPTTPLRQFTVLTPDGRAERMLADLGTEILTIPGITELGTYRVEAREGNATFEAGFSVNAPLEESDLTRLPEEALAELFGVEELAISRDASELERLTDEGRVGRELYAWLMVLVVTVLTAEGLLANFFYRKAKPTEQSF